MKVKTKNGKINWTCLKDECPENCCGPIGENLDEEVDEDEEEEEGLPVEVFDLPVEAIPITPAEARRIASNGGKSKIKTLKTGCYIKYNDEGNCMLFKQGGCSIYEHRPVICKAYPFYYDSTMGLCIDGRCSGVGKGYTKPSDLETVIVSLKSIYRGHFKKAEQWLKG